MTVGELRCSVVEARCVKLRKTWSVTGRVNKKPVEHENPMYQSPLPKSLELNIHSPVPSHSEELQGPVELLPVWRCRHLLLHTAQD